MGKTRVSCLGFGSLTAILLLTASTAFAQQTAPSWSAIEQATGQSIVVVRNDNSSQSGRLEETSPDSLTISDREHRSVMTRDQVRQVFSQTSRSRKRGALWGLALGGGGGAIAGAAIVQPCSSSNFCIVNISRGEGAAAGAAVGAAVGSIVGALVGGGHKKVLLYERTSALSRLQEHYEPDDENRSAIH